MRMVFGLAVAAGLSAAVLPLTADPASAQATCRQKCTTEEQACLKRTGNKSQCGSRAQHCLAKCK
jgi:hypothetical protein